MKNDVAKYLLVPGALGLALACPTQGIFAQEAQDLKGPVSNIMVSQPHEEPNLEVRVSSENPGPESVQKEDTTAENDSATGEKITLTVGEDHVPADGSELTFDELLGNEDKDKKTSDTVATKDDEKSEDKDDKKKEEKEGDKTSSKTKDDESVRYHHPYEDENHNKNFQDHSIEAENDGTYKIEKGKELTDEEIKKEFEEYKKNASSFVKIQEWIPKLKEMNLLGLDKDEKSQFYKMELNGGKTIYSAKGFKPYVDKYGNAYVHDLTDDRVYFVGGGYNAGSYGPSVANIKNIYGSSSDDIKNAAEDIKNSRYKGRERNSKLESLKYDGAYVVKRVDENGIPYYEFYEDYENWKDSYQEVEKDLVEIEKLMKETPSPLMKEWGLNHDYEIYTRAYKAALVNTYISNNKDKFKGMTPEDHKNIIDYVYRFGLNLEADESMVSKSEDNGYVNVSPEGYAKRYVNEKGEVYYKYRYQVSFNSITSSDKYSSTKLDIYAPTMAENLKFFLNGVQGYTINEDGTYSYENKDVDNIELGVINTKDKKTRELLREDWLKTNDSLIFDRHWEEYVAEDVWNKEDYKHKENTFSIPYYNDIKGRKILENKVVEFDRNVVFENDKPTIYNGYAKDGTRKKIYVDDPALKNEPIIDKSAYIDPANYYTDYQVVRPEKHYRHFRLVNPQQGGPVTFIVEFDITEDQVKKSPNIGLGARMLGYLNESDPTAFNFNSHSYIDKKSSSRPGSQVTNDMYDGMNEGETGQIIEETLRSRESDLYASIYNHPELIKPGTFDINGFYGNSGGAPSEYTGDKYRIGLKTGKNTYDYGEFIESYLVKSIDPFASNKLDDLSNPLRIKMKTHGASSFDIGIQIANGYGRYGDYRVNTRLNEDKFIENLMKFTNVKMPRADKLASKGLSSVYKDLGFEDVTDRFK